MCWKNGQKDRKICWKNGQNDPKMCWKNGQNVIHGAEIYWLPIEIKSGKNYRRHAALDNVLASEHYDIPLALVFQNGNVKVEGSTIYLPIYMLMFLQREEMLTLQDYKYKPDIEALR